MPPVQSQFYENHAASKRTTASIKRLPILFCLFVSNFIYADQSSVDWKSKGLLDNATQTELQRYEQFLLTFYTPPQFHTAEDAKGWIAHLQNNAEDSITTAANLGTFHISQSRELLELTASRPGGNYRLKWVATRSLSLIAARESAPLLVGLLDHPNANIRLYARVGLTEITGKYLGAHKDQWQHYFAGKTGPADPKAAGPIEKTMAGDHKRAVEKLRQVIDDHYSYRDLRGVDWHKAFAEFGPRMERAQTPEQFAEAAAKMLERARDPHLWVKIGNRAIGGFKRNARRNYNVTVMRNVVPGFAVNNRRISTGKFEDGIGYILINDWAKEGGALEPAFAALKDFQNSPGVIIDVRPNAGGSETLARQFAGCFTDKPVLYAKHVYRKSGEPNGFTKPMDRILQPNHAQETFKGKTVVLMGQVNMSSNESFLLMMKHSGCTMIGEGSCGSSGNPRPYDLGNGVNVSLPSWKALLPDGSCLEGRGISPDIVVKTTDEQLKHSDPVLEGALEFLRKK